MWEFNDQKEEIELNVNEIKLFQSLLINFQTKMNSIQSNFDKLSDSKLI
jgi:hypothetical protein